MVILLAVLVLYLGNGLCRLVGYRKVAAAIGNLSGAVRERPAGYGITASGLHLNSSGAMHKGWIKALWRMYLGQDGVAVYGHTCD